MEKCPCCKKPFHLPKWFSTPLPRKYKYSLEENIKRCNQFSKIWIEKWLEVINQNN